MQRAGLFGVPWPHFDFRGLVLNALNRCWPVTYPDFAEPRFPPVENEAEIVLCSSICRESASLLLTETPVAGLPGWMRLSERIVGTTLGAGLALRKCSTPWQLYLQRGR